MKNYGMFKKAFAMNGHIPNIKDLTSTPSLDEIAGLIPGWLHLNNIVNFRLEYMSKRMQEDLQTTLEQVQKEGVEFIKRITHPETTERVVPQLMELVESQSDTRISSFYQYIKLPQQDYQWFLTTSKLLDGKFVISTTIPLAVLKDFDKNIIDVLNENVFLKSNLGKYHMLTKREKEIIKELIRGKTNLQIAEELNLSAFTIKTHRQNIYKKLEISNICDLVVFSKAFGIS